jgi:hypothetical protein
MILGELAQIFLYLFENKIIFSVVIFVATKKGRTIFSPLLLDPGAGVDKRPVPG